MFFNQDNKDDKTPENDPFFQAAPQPVELFERKPTKTVSVRLFAFVLCAAILATALLTTLLSTEITRMRYLSELLIKEQKIQQLESVLGDDDSEVAVITSILNRYSYYKDFISTEEFIDQIIADYQEQTGDRYVAYYTPEEYENLTATTYEGIGVVTVVDSLEVDGTLYNGYRVIRCLDDAPAKQAGIYKNDFIYAIKVDGEFRLVSEIGMDLALNHISGEAGTATEFRVFRMDGDGYQTHEFAIIRRELETPSISYAYRDGDNTTAIVRIEQFDVKTPAQFRTTVDMLLANGVKNFVFDIRDNPGGDVLSVKAILSFFLSEGDLILTAAKMDGSQAVSYVTEPMSYTGYYEDCRVKREEIGMYSDLNAVVLCNENTASAAEVFAATFRDYGLAPIVGEKTFGKGIIQTVFDLSAWGCSGYFKLTTYAYTTKCGIGYHGVGIFPDVEVVLADEAKSYYIGDIPQSIDNQLQAGFDALSTAG